MDLKFPHHECEIAQGHAATGLKPVRYWMHANMLTLNGKKMSKSTGNSLLPAELFSGENDLLEKAYDPIVVRFFMMQAHYRSTLDFSSDALNASEKGFFRLMEGLKQASDMPVSNTSSFDVQGLINKFYEAMNDDFNSPILIAHLFEAVKQINAIHSKTETITESDKLTLIEELNSFVFDVLGLKELSSEGDDSLDVVMELVLQMRQTARETKDWTTSDAIRDKLAEAGIVVKDGKDGVTWSKG
jgi:cysteinyl-tRNA synthetase